MLAFDCTGLSLRTQRKIALSREEIAGKKTTVR